MARILVTYGWVRSSYSVVRALGRQGETVYVGYSEASSMAVHSRYCKAGVRLPDFFDDPLGYVEAVASACRKYDIEVLVPGHEDLYWLARYRDYLPGKTKLVHSSVKSLEQAMDKATVLECAKKVDCPVPETKTFFSLAELDKIALKHDYPAVLKTRTGNSAKGVAICHDSEELCMKARNWIDRYRFSKRQYPVVQQYLPGRAIGTCHLFRNGIPVAAFSERYLRSKGGGTFGTSTLRCSYDAPEAVDAGNSLLRSLKWNGVAHLDFIEDSLGIYRLIEVNPRFWGALELSIASGVNFPALLVDMALARGIRSQTAPKSGLTYRWLLGEGILLVNCLTKGNFKAAAQLLKRNGPGGFDDLFLDDPLPFIFEVISYGKRYFNSGSVNPVSPGMIKGV